MFPVTSPVTIRLTEPVMDTVHVRTTTEPDITQASVRHCAIASVSRGLGPRDRVNSTESEEADPLYPHVARAGATWDAP
jgi:hypothetical protein